jgi:hypothetical protein
LSERLLSLPLRFLRKKQERAATATRMMASGSRPISAKIEDRIEDREQKMEARRTCVLANGTTASGTDCASVQNERREEAKERIMERRGEALRAMAHVLTGRLNAAIERETKLADRIDSRIIKLKSRGIDTSVAEARIAVVRTKLTEAKAAVTLATSKVESAVTNADTIASSTSRGDAGKEVRDIMTTAKEAIIAAHKALVEALTGLKANVKATTTPETASSTGTL